MELDAALEDADKGQRLCQISFGSEGWVPKDHYETAMALSKKLKEVLAAAKSAEEWAEVEVHWPLGDMDEEKYMYRIDLDILRCHYPICIRD